MLCIKRIDSNEWRTIDGMFVPLNRVLFGPKELLRPGTPSCARDVMKKIGMAIPMALYELTINADGHVEFSRISP